MDGLTLGDVLYVLAENIDSHAILAALCRVSKQYHAIFTPQLYKQIWLEPTELKCLERTLQLSKESCLEHTEYLRIRSRIRFPAGVTGVIANRVKVSLFPSKYDLLSRRRRRV